MNVIDIVRKALIESGHDGLFNENAECACLVDDLQPCGDDFSQCQPGYKHVPENPDSESDWEVKPHKQDQ